MALYGSPELDENGNIIIPIVGSGSEKTKKKKFKLYKVVVPLVIVGGLVITISTSVKAINKAKNDIKYRDLKNNNIAFEQSIDKNDSISALMTQKDKDEYEKFRQMIHLRDLCESIDLDKYEAYELDYNNITYEHALDLYNYYYSNNLYRDVADWNDTCCELKSIVNAINKFEKEHGKDLVTRMFANVAADKVTSSNGISNQRVDTVSIKNLRVNIKYFDDNNQVREITSKKLTNKDGIKVEQIDKAIDKGDYLDAMGYLGAYEASDYEVDIAKDEPYQKK